MEETMDDLTEDQRQLLSDRDDDGRVFSPRTREIDDLVERGYLEESVFHRGCFVVKKTATGRRVES